MAKIRVQITDPCHLSLFFIYINKIYWRQFPVTYRWYRWKKECAFYITGNSSGFPVTIRVSKDTLIL